MPTKYSDFMPGFINSKHQFLKKIIEHFIPLEPELELWGSLPKQTNLNIKKHEKSVSFFRKHFFKQKEILLTKKNYQKIISELANEDTVEKFTWGLIKNDIPLALCANWDNHVIICGSKYSASKNIRILMQSLAEKGVITDYEVIKDEK